MNQEYLARIGLVAALLIGLPAAAKSEEQIEVLYASPSGAFRIESKFPDQSADDATADIWVVSTKDPAQRAKLPKQSPDSPTDDEFHFSPDEEWLFGTRHVGSGLRYGNIYHLRKPLGIEVVGKHGAFNELVWEQGVKLGALKRDYSADGVYAMTAFGNWSLDSSRLLIRLCGGEKKGSMLCGFFYFNTRTNKFEATDYSRKLSKLKRGPLACAEPIDSLLPEAELKLRFDTLDRELNKKYAEILAKADKAGSASPRSAARLAERAGCRRKILPATFPNGRQSFTSSSVPRRRHRGAHRRDR
jgi:hypothetical protein